MANQIQDDEISCWETKINNYSNSPTELLNLWTSLTAKTGPFASKENLSHPRILSLFYRYAVFLRQKDTTVAAKSTSINLNFGNCNLWILAGYDEPTMMVHYFYIVIFSAFF